jgi:hypothetical protein
MDDHFQDLRMLLKTQQPLEGQWERCDSPVFVAKDVLADQRAKDIFP